MCGSMVDIQSPTAEIRQGKKVTFLVLAYSDCPDKKAVKRSSFCHSWLSHGEGHIDIGVVYERIMANGPISGTYRSCSWDKRRMLTDQSGELVCVNGCRW